MTQAKHTYTLHTLRGGGIAGTAWTNDNLDHGVPSEEASWGVKYRSRDVALQATGGSHTGASGCVVLVYLDGVEIDKEGRPVDAPATRRPRP